MKVLVFSDSHGRMLEMYDAIARENPDAVIHLGDCYEDAHELQYSEPDLPVYAVRGNNDWGMEVPDHRLIRLADVPIYLTHGHREGVSFTSSGRVPAHAAEQGCRMALFGHTHIVYHEIENGITVVNPGSISLPRMGTASYAVILLDDGQIIQITHQDTQGLPWTAEKKRKQKRMGWF